jgi:hypothetical protein
MTDEYLRLKRRARQVFAAGELPDDMLDIIRNSEMDERHQHLDSLIPLDPVSLPRPVIPMDQSVTSGRDGPGIELGQQG